MLLTLIQTGGNAADNTPFDLTPPNLFILASAVAILLGGLGIFWKTQPGSRKYLTSIWIALLLIALFPVLLLGSFFPSSTVDISTKILGMTVTAAGAIAFFIFILVFGTRKTLDAVNKDKIIAERAELRRRVRQLEHFDSAQKSNDGDKVLFPGSRFTYELTGLKKNKKRIHLVTGGLEFVHGVDVWVNSENTNMFMASYFDRSVSGTIRYGGAKKDKAGNVIEDLIFDELKEQMGQYRSVVAATVLVTGPGELAKSNGVKKIFHVATVHGAAGEGYRPVGKLASCVFNVLREADAEQYAGDGLRSVLFPLLGAGQGSGPLIPIVEDLLNAAVLYFEKRPDSRIDDVYFGVLRKKHLDACKYVLCNSPSVVETGQGEFDFGEEDEAPPQQGEQHGRPER